MARFKYLVSYMIYGSDTMRQSMLSNYEYLTIPNAIIAYQSKLLFNSYTILELQLSKIDRKLEPDMYKEVEKLAQGLFDSWVALGYREGGTNGLRV